MLQPTVTVFGSCRVYNPCSLLAKAGHVRLSQKNIFGFVHCSSEILQQFELVCGAKQAPARLRSYLNIPSQWQTPQKQSREYFHELFSDTDIFVVEVSSVRQIKYKAFFLQINRTRELLARDRPALKQWWEPLTRAGKNNVGVLKTLDMNAFELEIATELQAFEQDAASVYRDIVRISNFLGKKVLFVPHFNMDYNGEPILQRTIIVDAMKKLSRPGSRVFDPKREIIMAGFLNSIQDLGHYKPAFEPHIADCVLAKITELQAS